VAPHLVALLNPTIFEVESYRVLSGLVVQMHKDAGLRLIAISSPSPGDGKTSTAISLASILAREPNARVLLVEAELRRPSLVAYLGVRRTSEKGLVQAILAPTLSLENVVWQCPPLNLDLLPAGRSLDSPYDVLKLPRFRELLQEARQLYDYVVIDTPPLVPFADCRLIEKCIDGFLIVVAAHKTPRKLLEEALHVTDPAKIIGLVFNQDDNQTSSYYRVYRYNIQSRNGQQKRP
jgi:capsular exopolysaccharide synthesis family protein